MSSELLENSELINVQIELDYLSELSTQINDCQNNLRNIQWEMKENFERDKRRLLDFRLKFGKKIEEAKHYYWALSNLEMEKANEEKLRNQLQENQQKLDKILSEISPDISESKCNQIKYYREKINELKLNMQFVSVQCISKSEKLAKVKNKYSRSIELTKEYFSVKHNSVEASNYLKELMNEYQDKLLECKQKYSEHMSNLEKLSTEIHLQRSYKNLIDSRLSQPMPNCEYSSIHSYNLEDKLFKSRKSYKHDEKYGENYNFEEHDQEFTDNGEANNEGFSSSQFSQSQSHLNQSIFSDQSELPSPCKSINLPLGCNGGFIVDKSKNVTWHPLL